MLHVHPNTLRHWSDEGKIVCYRITERGDRRFRLEDVENFLAGLNPFKVSQKKRVEITQPRLYLKKEPT